MIRVSKWKLFFASILLTMSLMLGSSYLHRPGSRFSNTPKMKRIAHDIFLSSQLWPRNLPVLKRRDIKTIVDVRPDGEAADQPPSAEMKALAERNGLNFYYIPAPHEGIPNDAVKALDRALTPDALPAILYCRTGRRAVRLFAMVQASRIDGPGSEAIVQMVRGAGVFRGRTGGQGKLSYRLSQRKSAPLAPTRMPQPHTALMRAISSEPKGDTHAFVAGSGSPGRH